MDTSIFLTIVHNYSRFTWIFFLTNKTKVRHFLQDFVTLTENQFFFASLRRYVPIMANNFFLMISIIVRVFFMKLLMLQLLNKTRLLRGSINIFSMCVMLFFFKQKYQTFSGPIHLNWLFILVIGYPLLFSVSISLWISLFY